VMNVCGLAIEAFSSPGGGGSIVKYEMRWDGW